MLDIVIERLLLAQGLSSEVLTIFSTPCSYTSHAKSGSSIVLLWGTILSRKTADNTCPFLLIIGCQRTRARQKDLAGGHRGYL